MLRLLGSIITAALVACAMMGYAANLDATSATFSAGSATVSSCDRDGVEVRYELGWNGHFSVQRVEITRIDDACIGLRLALVLVVAGEPVEVGIAPIPSSAPDGNAVSLDVPGDVRASDLEGAEVVIT